MKRLALLSLAMMLTFGSAGGGAQSSGDLSRVTMRVLDDISGIAAVVIVLEPVPPAP